METTTGNVPLSPLLKTALATVNQSSSNADGGAVNEENAKCFPEDKVSKDYYFDSYAHLYVFRCREKPLHLHFLLVEFTRKC